MQSAYVGAAADGVPRGHAPSIGEATAPDVACTPEVSGKIPVGSPGDAGPDSTATPVVAPVVVVFETGSFAGVPRAPHETLHTASTSIVTQHVIRMRVG